MVSHLWCRQAEVFLPCRRVGPLETELPRLEEVGYVSDVAESPSDEISQVKFSIQNITVLGIYWVLFLPLLRQASRPGVWNGRRFTARGYAFMFELKGTKRIESEASQIWT